MSGDRPRSPRTACLAAAAAITASSTAAAVAQGIPGWIGGLAGVNLATFFLYSYDKAVAGGRRPRVPEAVLHLLALLGGSPAAVLGQLLLRHKCSKRPFQAATWGILGLQLAILAGVLWGWSHPPEWLQGWLRPAG